MDNNHSMIPVEAHELLSLINAAYMARKEKRRLDRLKRAEVISQQITKGFWKRRLKYTVAEAILAIENAPYTPFSVDTSSENRLLSLAKWETEFEEVDTWRAIFRLDTASRGWPSTKVIWVDADIMATIKLYAPEGYKLLRAKSGDLAA